MNRKSGSAGLQLNSVRRWKPDVEPSSQRSPTERGSGKRPVEAGGQGGPQGAHVAGVGGGGARKEGAGGGDARQALMDSDSLQSQLIKCVTSQKTQRLFRIYILFQATVPWRPGHQLKPLRRFC